MEELRAEVAALGVDAAQLVLKPTVSATAWLTWRVSRDARVLPEGFSDALAQHDFIVQPFVEEIVAGEWSLVFFGGTFSHAVIKRPREGDFRVQDDFGGRAELVRAPGTLVSTAACVLACAPGSSIYARVDGVETSAGFVLLELELVEPHLFLALAPGAPARFADALEQALE
jgi:glutathione synthase/RimK-type ligase-like ATP-grasp enzyme